LAALASSKSHRATVDAVPVPATVLPPTIHTAEQHLQAVVLPLELPAEEAASLAAVAAVATPGHQNAGGTGGGGGGFGRILVRRRFVKNLQPAAPHLQEVGGSARCGVGWHVMMCDGTHFTLGISMVKQFMVVLQGCSIVGQNSHPC
jgi:hypothetical protein